MALALLADLLLLIPATRAALFALLDPKRTCPTIPALWSSLAVRRFNAAFQRLSDRAQVERQESGRSLWRTPAGSYWMPAASHGLLAFLLAEQEMGVYGDARFGVRPGDVVLDCGAHVGVYTKEALRRGARLVVAIEPSPENLECLRLNLAGELASGKAVIYPKGVWDREARLHMHLRPDNTGMDNVLGPTTPQDRIAEVPVTTIDKLVDELRLDRVDFIKMDIEGAERRALAGAAKTLATHKPRLAIASYHLPDDHAVIPAVVRRAQPHYRVSCRTCAYMQDRLVPEVLFFH